MSLAAAEQALRQNDIEAARRAAVAVYESDPAGAAGLLGRISLAAEDLDAAAYYGQIAVENHNPEGYTILADTVGRRGQRSQAEAIATAALTMNPRSGLLRTVLGEQKVRQAKWDEGTRDFIEALRLDEQDLVRTHLWRVLRALVDGTRAKKIPPSRAEGLIGTLRRQVDSNDPLAVMLQSAAIAIQQGRSLPPAMPPAAMPPAAMPPAAMPPAAMPPAARTAQPERPQHATPAEPVPTTRGGIPSQGAPAVPRPPIVSRQNLSALSTLMQRDREINEQLQEGVESLGLPAWPSNRVEQLDTLEAMRPTPLAIDQEEFRREHITVTSGSVASEIVIERALQSLLNPETYGPNIPTADSRGLTQLETALWEGALDRMVPISPVYLSDTQQCRQEVLALGAFLGACVVAPAVATWAFAQTPTDSEIDTAHGRLKPFDVARRWVDATDKDDVSLHAFLAHARRLTGEQIRYVLSHDTTENLKGAALSMRLAELWTNYWNSPTGVSQTEVADAIAPVLQTEDVIVFALARAHSPQSNKPSRYAQTAIAYVREDGSFLTLESRKHFAHFSKVNFRELNSRNARNVAELLMHLHLPGSSLASVPRVDEGRDEARLHVGLKYGDATRDYVLTHRPSSDIPWALTLS